MRRTRSCRSQLSPSSEPTAARRRSALVLPAVLTGALLSTTSFRNAAWAQGAESVRKTYSVPAGSLEDALNRFARQAGITLSFDPALVAGRRAGALRGDYTAQDGLAALLAPHQAERLFHHARPLAGTAQAPGAGGGLSGGSALPPV